ncbi:MAG TPA: hypothetical protein VGC54_10650 [Planctomycetota bacterium]
MLTLLWIALLPLPPAPFAAVAWQEEAARGPDQAALERQEPERSADLYRQWVVQTDQAVGSNLVRQVMARDHDGFGGVPDRYGIVSPQTSSGILRHMATAWVCPESQYHHDPLLIERMAAATQHLLASQHADGTIDLYTTNFHSPPDVAFVLENVCLALGLLRADGDPALAQLDAAIATFVERGAAALAVGGIHTPNHRWVVCMALARAYRLLPDPRYLARIDQWLAEQIDIDPDGQFTERSTAIYSPLTDRCLITVARLLDRPELLEPVRRNLEMTAYYMHADGEIATEGSRRQDQYSRGSMAAYAYPYRYLALHDGNGRFAAIARSIESRTPERLTGNLGLLLEDPTLRGGLPADAPLPTAYTKHFCHSDLVRIRRGEASATILGGNPALFSLHKGSAAVVVRMAQAFFGKGQFVSDSLVRDGDGWLLRQDQEGPYYQPLPGELLPDDGDWEKMDREQRPQSEVQRQRTTIRVTEADGVFELHIRIAGTAGVPVAVELGFRSGGTLHGVTAIEDLPAAWSFSGETGRFEYGDDTIEFGPGRVEHGWTALRGALPKLEGDSVYLTGFTPVDWKLRLR